ncbi:MAG: Cna B-type domain-containing protein [Clostridiaceae bacterium]|nr:Cna B-type domain-containing protein [Clostridiaceae bacterium]
MKRKWIALILAVALLITMVPLFKGLEVAAWGPPDPTYTLHVTGTKEWVGDDEDNRPNSVTLKLVDVNDTIVKDDIEVSKAGNWEFDFSVNVNEIETSYTLEEIGVLENYTSIPATFSVKKEVSCDLDDLEEMKKKSHYFPSTSDQILVIPYVNELFVWKSSWTDDEKAAINKKYAPSEVSFFEGNGRHLFGNNQYRFTVSTYSTYYGTQRYIAFDHYSAFHRRWESYAYTFRAGTVEFSTRYVPTTDVTITNTYIAGDPEPETINITVTKEWNDGDVEGTTRPTVTINLLADGLETDKSVQLDGTDGWTYTFKDLRKFDDDEEEIVYTVEEVEIDGYISETTDTAETGFTITNTPTIDITVTKIWEGGDVEGTTRPPVTIKLLDKNNGITHDFVESSISGGWTHTFTVPKYDDDGNEIKYEVEEVEIAGYTSKITKNAEGDFTITNKYGGDGGDGNDNGGEDPGPTQGPDPGPTPTTQPAEVPATETTTSEIVAGDEDEKTTTTTTQPTEVVAGDEDEVDVVPTGENYLYLVVAILFILGGVIVLVPAIKKVRVKK